MNEPLVTVKGVVKDYQMDTHTIRALDGIDLDLERGVMAAVIGPSGSGKSTLLHILGALDRPTSGQVVIDGIRLKGLAEAELTAYRRRKVGFVFQDYHLIPNLSALENVILPMEFAGVPPRGAEQRAGELLESVGLAQRASHRPNRLSGGEQQRVAIARALANDPPIILADEPTGNLDTATGEQIVRLLKAFVDSQGKTIIIVTHDAAIVSEADVKVHLKDGKIVRDGNASDAGDQFMIEGDRHVRKLQS